jgi:hypothetical protein
MMMKQLFAAALIVSASAVASAQQTTPEGTTKSPQAEQPSNQFNSKDYSPIQSSEVPSSLRTTLKDATYNGWESGKLYRNNNGEGYWLSTGSGNNAKNYYFDKNGTAIQKGASGSKKTSKGAGVGPGNTSENGSATDTDGNSNGSGSDDPKQ